MKPRSRNFTTLQNIGPILSVIQNMEFSELHSLGASLTGPLADAVEVVLQSQENRVIAALESCTTDMANASSAKELKDAAECQRELQLDLIELRTGESRENI